METSQVLLGLPCFSCDMNISMKYYLPPYQAGRGERSICCLFAGTSKISWEWGRAVYWCRQRLDLGHFLVLEEELRGGVGMLLSSSAYKHLEDNVVVVNSRIIVANFSGNPATTMICCYSPRNLLGWQRCSRLLQHTLWRNKEAT